ncbi:tRNA uridine-5-carboxymethylaminomethyl(34) synthesis GTPase MnmE [Rickettsiales endosymbiont of Peranema trichophorum]|uniref:tRNA uridine-5-carboxymethylaminomethyl(34) synthesis GTPase MnmE n=1 Tax=Rickettsiales endosymbiont of Peranema trichophorum TaxID=2486577 RepID=UPI00102314D3|nr:tRNA uridine-5-carboxymethylaminomethyl(34) synthesis GTPase MnmE [Rickettsiales endosymbiont of Peranema trichophorum]RZI47186.1 tRNA uridine-5-carboxymethylaminomethyl(34) synthesis GTPase MnmE [Rickettsiales endosymbiont of Peranema trichophorum]
MHRTIFALSTVPGKSAIAVIRISGADALKALQALGVDADIAPNRTYFHKLLDPVKRTILDEAIVVYFRAPHSFTGEDVVELYTHGSIAVVNDILSSMSYLSYLDPATPGEFSKRAFFNNKLDLTKAEALSLLIDAETTIQKDIALRQLQGDLYNLYHEWQNRLTTILSRLEALIDFPEDDISPTVIIATSEDIKVLRNEINRHLQSTCRGDIILRGINAVIAGAPNVGKSTLLNNITLSDSAIVSDIPGTTRDIINVKVDLGGFAVVFSDTPGIRATDDTIEREGIRRAMLKLEQADIVLYMVDSLDDLWNILDILQDRVDINKTIVILNKSDVMNEKELQRIEEWGASLIQSSNKFAYIVISAKTGAGIEDLLQMLSQRLRDVYPVSNDPIITKIRYRKALETCQECLNKFDEKKSLELMAEDIRMASAAIGSIIGNYDIETVLDQIFSNFCIGK